jgi:sugar/nucleoside kinase (ribokinase family)
MVRLFAAGGMIIDNVVSADGTVHRETLGGNAVYSAAGARLWQGDVGIVAVVPANYPVRWLETLREAGIDTTGITVREDFVSCSEWFFYRSDGSRADRLYAEPGTFEAFGLAGDRLEPDQAAAFEARLRTRPVAGLDFAAFRRLYPVRSADVPASYRHAVGVHLAPNSPAAQRGMAQDLHREGRRITLDPGSHAAELVDALLSELLPLLDAILPSEKELRVMVPGMSNADGLAQLRRAGASVAVVKLAAAGAMLVDAAHNVPCAIPSLPVEAVDPTGAGDAFCGGFLAGLVATGDPVCAAVCGTVSASFAVESFGPFRLFAARHDEAIQRWKILAQRCALPHADQCLSELEALRRPCP